MPHFSERSESNLQTCHEDLISLFRQVIKKYDCTIIRGHRGEEDQNEAYRTGKSTLKFPESKHNSYPSLAVDVVPYPIDWEDRNRFYHFAGFVLAVAEAQGVKIRWGGDWDGDITGAGSKDQSFMDLPHFELLENA